MTTEYEVRSVLAAVDCGHCHHQLTVVDARDLPDEVLVCANCEAANFPPSTH